MLNPGRSPLRRLNRFEYNNTIEDLLGDESAPANTFPLEEQALGFDNNADVLRASQLLVEAYIGAAQQLATTLVSTLSTRLPCAATAAPTG